ncbi:MAG: sce7726 family protein [Bacteroidales bacterium]|nr:sce7726 family protein [Bacteroidales bacterium]
MQFKTTYSQNQLRDYSALFLRNEAKSWLKSDFTSVNCKIERYDRHWKNSSNTTYYDYLKYVYTILEKYYQNEYVVKNAFLTEWLINEIGQSNSRVFSEYRVGNAIADLAIFNGNSKVFEIKSEYDTDNRLVFQLENYRKAFNQIFLIIPETKLFIYKKYDFRVGIITYKRSPTQKFILYRNAINNSEVDAKTIMHILHTPEYKAIVKSYFGNLPKLTSFNQFHICSNLIKQIPPKELNKYFIEQMKKRSFENVMSSRYYKIFNQLSLSLKLDKKAMKNLIDNIKSPIND